MPRGRLSRPRQSRPRSAPIENWVHPALPLDDPWRASAQVTPETAPGTSRSSTRGPAPHAWFRQRMRESASYRRARAGRRGRRPRSRPLPRRAAARRSVGVIGAHGSVAWNSIAKVALLPLPRCSTRDPRLIEPAAPRLARCATRRSTSRQPTSHKRRGASMAADPEHCVDSPSSQRPMRRRYRLHALPYQADACT